MDAVIELTDLSLAQQTKLQELYQHEEKLREFANKVTIQLMEYLFPGRGHHVFMVYHSRANRNLLEFFNLTSLDIRETILVNIYHNDTLYSNC